MASVLDPFGRDPATYDEALAEYARLHTSQRHRVYNLARETFAAAEELRKGRGPGSAAAKLFAKLGPHIQTRNELERAVVSSLLAAPLPLGLGRAPLFLSPALRRLPQLVRQAVYRLYRGGALEVELVSHATASGGQGVPVETFLVVARPRKLNYRLVWGVGPFGRLD